VAARSAAELVVLLDQLIAGLLRPVRVDAEGADPEGTPERLPLELAEGRQRLDLIEPDD
jgi:hypothetical protein